MTVDLNDPALFQPTTPAMVAPAKPKPHRHDWKFDRLRGDAAVCVRCGKLRDDAAVKRGRTSLRAGKDAERAIAKAYPNAVRTGQHGGPDDVLVGDLFIVQSKAGGWFSERYWNELAKLPRAGGRIPTLIVSDRPGPGRKTRRMVVRLMSDDVALHGTDAGGDAE